MWDYILDNLGLVITTIFGAGGVGAYLFERKRNQAQTKGVMAESKQKELDNVDAVVQLYKQALEDEVERSANKFTELVQAYDRKIKILEDEIKAHKRRYTLLKQENTDLRRRLKL